MRCCVQRATRGRGARGRVTGCVRALPPALTRIDSVAVVRQRGCRHLRARTVADAGQRHPPCRTTARMSYRGTLPTRRASFDFCGVEACARSDGEGCGPRVALARLLVQAPTVVLADEPTGALDHDNAEVVLRVLREFAQQGSAVLIATHSDAVRATCDRAFALPGVVGSRGQSTTAATASTSTSWSS
ncbi:hypothetical protein EDF55_0342 [Curtobacterium sp. ZW137]|nr:hypothetical protein EDF55_0342 [Curtobacterium sp. ZW137]